MIVGRNMNKTWQEFATYAVIGIANSVIHWQLFFISRNAFELSQALSNFLAFCAAASFSFYANSLYTFEANASMARYLVFMASVGAISLGIGALADHWQWPGLVTLTMFSGISLIVGFLISKWLIYREPKR
jgi:putative flippase GtrA